MSKWSQDSKTMGNNWTGETVKCKETWYRWFKKKYMKFGTTCDICTPTKSRWHHSNLQSMDTLRTNSKYSHYIFIPKAAFIPFVNDQVTITNDNTGDYRLTLKIQNTHV